MAIAAPIRNVSDTALWVAMYRALESERPDALFDDPHARRMAGERGEAIVRAVPGGWSMAWAMTIRTAVIDELVLSCVKRGARTVVNLGAGLDTRAFRLALPAELCWLDVDLPAMIAYRSDCLSGVNATCQHAHLAADVCDEAALRPVLARARQGQSPVLVLTEGLLLYLAPEQVAILARWLHAEALSKWWISDLISPSLLETAGAHWGADLTAADAPFRFAPADRTRFFSPLGWREEEFRSTWDESLRLNRSMPMVAAMWTTFGKPWMTGAHERLRQSSGVSLMEAVR